MGCWETAGLLQFVDIQLQLSPRQHNNYNPARFGIDDRRKKKETTRAGKMSNELHDSKRSNSRSRTSRPTTPLRPSSRSSFRDSARSAGESDAPFPLNVFEPAFAELSDAMADLEANMMHFQLMHESLARFSESFASFQYGLNMNAFCVDFPEVCALVYSAKWGHISLLSKGSGSRIIPPR